MKARLTAVALVGMLGIGAAIAEDFANDGNYLLANCTIAKKYIDGETTETGGDTFRFGMCLGVVEGARNMMMLMESVLDKSRRTCFPENGIKNDQAVRIVLKYLNDHPAELHQDQTYLTFMAMRNAFHCK
jgi:hypothetical protein